MNSLKTFHTFGLNHQAEQIHKIESINDIKPLIGQVLHHDFVLLGEGSNSVFLSDIKVPVYINRLLGKYYDEDNSYYYLTAMAGENWHEFVVWSLENEIFGLENLALIPGTVGAAPIQNIGAYGREVKSFIASVEYVDLTTGEQKTLLNKDCLFSYRDSIFKQQLKEVALITKVNFKIPKKWLPEVSYAGLSELTNPNPTDIFNKVVHIRRSKLPNPTEIGNAGSFFKNPILTGDSAKKFKDDWPLCPVYKVDGGIKLAAGWLIDQCKLKGKGVAGVSVHEQQALVLINTLGEAMGTDLIKTIEMVVTSVKSKFNVELEPEVRAFSESGEVGLRWERNNDGKE